jgi:hypothetical protein
VNARIEGILKLLLKKKLSLSPHLSLPPSLSLSISLSLPLADVEVESLGRLALRN